MTYSFIALPAYSPSFSLVSLMFFCLPQFSWSSTYCFKALFSLNMLAVVSSTLAIRLSASSSQICKALTVFFSSFMSYFFTDTSLATLFKVMLIFVISANISSMLFLWLASGLAGLAGSASMIAVAFKQISTLRLPWIIWMAHTCITPLNFGQGESANYLWQPLKYQRVCRLVLNNRQRVTGLYPRCIPQVSLTWLPDNSNVDTMTNNYWVVCVVLMFLGCCIFLYH